VDSAEVKSLRTTELFDSAEQTVGFYSYEITSWLMQGVRDAIVSGSGYYHCVCVLRVPKILVASVGLVL
jgi:hypothetical protein